MGARVHRSFRLTEDVASQLAGWAAERGMSATEMVEAAIRAYVAVPRSEAHSEAHAAIAALTAQLEAKDGQIARLMDALATAQESVRASQMLEAASLSKALAPGDAGAVGDTEGPGEPSGLMARVRAWWARGRQC